MNPGTRILRLLIIESGAYHDMWRRTYVTDWGGEVQQALDEKLSGLTQFTASNVAPVAGKFLKVNAAPEKQIVIPNGMGSRRFRFMMMVEITDLTGIRTIEILTGYSDAMDLSNGMANFGTQMSNQINPDLVFNINSIMQIAETVEHTPSGRQTIRTMVDNSHLLFDKHGKGMAGNAREDFVRPEDIFSIMSLNSIPGDVSRESYDARTVMSPRPVKSRRANGVAANYMANVMESHNAAWVEQQLGGAEQGLYAAALGNAAEKVATTDPFLAILKQIRGRQYVEGVFTLRNLEMIDPSALNNRQITRTTVLSPAERQTTDARVGTERWDGSGLEQQWATILSQAVPAIMMDLALLGIQFSATNRAFLGAPHVVGITGHQGIEENVNLSRNLMVFEKRIISELLTDLSRNGLIDYHIEMFVDILDELRIRISIQGKPHIPFKAATFCDALTVPILTNNRGLASTLANDFELMHNQIISSKSEKVGLGIGSGLGMNLGVSSSY